MADKLGAANVEFGANIAPLKKGLSQALGAAKGFGAAFTSALGPVAALIAGALAIKESIASFAAGEEGIANLSNALKATGQNVNEIMPKFETLGGSVWGCAVHPDGTWYWTSSNRQLFACDKGSGALTLLGTIAHVLAPHTSIAFDSTGKGYIGGSLSFQTFSVETLTATAGPNYSGDPGGGPRYIIVDG